MDTGLNINHPDIAEHRQSICGVNFVSTLDREAEDLWLDAGEHGTHVTGTIAGNGFLERQLAGMAPSVQHIRIAKVFGAYTYGSSAAVARAMDYFAQPSGCGESPTKVKPLIVNMSLAATARIWEGRDAGTRKLDSVAWSHRQLYVVSAANSDIHGFANFGAGKNALSIGAARKSGSITGALRRAASPLPGTVSIGRCRRCSARCVRATARRRHAACLSPGGRGARTP